MFGATGWIRTSGFRDLQSLALGLSATVALSWYLVLDSNQHNPSCKDGPSPLGSTRH
jgi:hypothetical protein